MEYKFIEMLSLDFKAADEQTNRQSVSYRFGLMKNRMNLVQSRLTDISTMIKLKNPSLLQSIQRASSMQMSQQLKKTALSPGGYNSTGRISR